MDKLRALATMEQLDALERMELERFNMRTEENRRQRESCALATALVHERECRRRERKKHRQEINGMMTFILVGVCIVLMIACALSSAPWTALLAILLAAAVMRKGGWIG